MNIIWNIICTWFSQTYSTVKLRTCKDLILPTSTQLILFCWWYEGKFMNPTKNIILSTNIFHKITSNFLSVRFCHFNIEKALIITNNSTMNTKTVGLQYKHEITVFNPQISMITPMKRINLFLPVFCWIVIYVRKLN